MRIAIFIDQIFWRDGDVLSTDESYILFPASFVQTGIEIVLIGREAPHRRRAAYVLDHPNISLVPLPFYPDLARLWSAKPTIYSRIRHRISAEAPSWDAILVCGPHPIGQMIARQCIALGVPVGLIVRQNLARRMSAYRGLKRIVTVLGARLLEWDFRRLARGRTVFTVGAEMAGEYNRFTPHVHNHFPCLVTDEQFRQFSATPAYGEATRLLCVGRLAPEKGLGFLFEAMAVLKQRSIRCRLDLVGNGPLEHELRKRATELRLASDVTFHGYVPYGPALFDLYRQAGTLVLPSTSEGFPQVINEALCIGLPTIASAVGGIPSFLKDGETALIVPPADVPALAQAIARMVRDEDLRKRLRSKGRALMADNTLEANRARVLEAICEEMMTSDANATSNHSLEIRA